MTNTTNNPAPSLEQGSSLNTMSSNIIYKEKKKEKIGLATALHPHLTASKLTTEHPESFVSVIFKEYKNCFDNHFNEPGFEVTQTLDESVATAYATSQSHKNEKKYK